MEASKNKKYYVTKNNSAIIAFTTGNGEIETQGFRMIGTHTDSPSFKIKPNAEITAGSGNKLNVEAYGAVILSTWFDRPLSVSGRVVLKGQESAAPKERFLFVERPILTIPSVAIHFNRKVNEGFALNVQQDLLPLFNGRIAALISKELGIPEDEILDYELYLHDCSKGCLLGIDKEYLSASRLDDLWMVFAGLRALLDSHDTDCSKMLLCFDNEEVGSNSMMGARSTFMRDVIERICIGLNKEHESYYRAISNSIMVSADLAHAVHHNYADKHDPSNRPELGKGPVLKYSAEQKYATTANSAAIFISACEKAGVPYQKFVNRSDMPGGSTIGAIISANLGLSVVDVGAPVLAMHSVRELGAVKDNEYMIRAFKAFYEWGC